jgi:hypothetical protein
MSVSICTRSVFASLAAAFSWLLCAHAHAGPPFKTDDPTPVAFGHYELYTAAIGTHVKGDTSGALPGVELTYGLIPNGQLQIGGEAAFDSPADGATHFGYGDTELSFKYRFIQEETNGFGPQVAIFPAVHFPTGNRDRGLGAGHVRVFLPVWVQKSFGNWTTYGGGGYWINRDDDLGDKNYWFFGWLLERKITEKLMLGGEIFHQTAATVDGKDSSGFDLGGTYDFDEHNHLLFSAGRGFENASDTNLFSWYLGWELTY